MQLTVILDGAAEDWHTGPTCMERADLPTLDRLARRSRGGFFDPRDPETGKVQTDIIIASILGVKPATWPGRAFYEKSLFPALRRRPFSFILRFHDANEGVPARVTRAKKHAAADRVRRLLAAADLHVQPRDHARLGLSDLVSGSVQSERALAMLKDRLGACIGKYGLRCKFLDLSYGLRQAHPLFRHRPALFTFSRGSQPAVMELAGITNLPAARPTEFCIEAQREAMEAFAAALATGRYKSAVLYFKDPDWASHSGDADRKVAAIAGFDGLLGSLLGAADVPRFKQIAVLSDHRTNVGSPQPSDAPSPYWIWRPEHTPRPNARFSERWLASQPTAPKPLSLEQLHRTIFPGRERTADAAF